LGDVMVTMRRQLLQATAIAALALVIFTYVTYIGPGPTPQGDTGGERDPFGLGPLPELVPGDGLLQRLQAAQDHIIGYLANDHGNALYIVDLTEEVYLGKVEFKTESNRGGPSGISLSQDGSRILVTRSKFSNDILVVDSLSLELLKRIPGGRYNKRIVPNYERDEAYVLSGHYLEQKIHILDLGSLEITDSIGLSSQPGTAALSPDSETLYATVDSGVVFIDLETREVTMEFDMNTTYWKRVVVHPSGDRLFVVNNPHMKDRWPLVEVFNTSTGAKITNIWGLTNETTWDGAVTCIAISPDGRKLYSVSQENLMVVVNTTSYGEISRKDVSQDKYVGGKPDYIYFSDDGLKAYLVYGGGIPIDTPVPDNPSVIGVMDTRQYTFSKIITLDEYAGAGQMAILTQPGE